MEEKRTGIPVASSRSALPRPTSRLPLARPTVPSADSSRLANSGTTSSFPSTSSARNSTTSKLRAVPSRDRLNGPSQALRKPQKASNPPVSSQTTLRGLNPRPGARGGTLRGQQVAPVQEPDGLENEPVLQSSLARKPSSQSIAADADTIFEDDDIPSNMMAPPPLTSPIDQDALPSDLWSTPRKPRPSLTERTMETLSQLPSSPAVKRRGSNFFETDSSRRPASRGSNWSSRPGSSYQTDGTNRPSSSSHSRPGSSSGALDNPFRSSTSTYQPPLPPVRGTPAKRASISNLRTPNPKASTATAPRSSLSKMPSRSSLSAAATGPRSPSPVKQSDISVSKKGSKTLAARPAKPRGEVNGLFKKPSVPSLTQPKLRSSGVPVHPRKASLGSGRSSTTSGEDRNLSSASNASTAPTVESPEDPPSQTPRKSSAALRDQIAKAKAAKRAAAGRVSGVSRLPESEEAPVVPTDDTFDFGLHNDPFGQSKFEDTNGKVLQARIKDGRATGKLNISAMGFKQIPEEVLKMYDLEAVGGYGGDWAESVDLCRLVAADNELETIDDTIFPDSDPSSMADDEDGSGHQFGGLESLDLHGNTLIAIPTGLRRLQLLTSLNLAHNKLTNDCLSIISQIPAMRDLKLGHNLLYGGLDTSISKLENLEILDVRGNNITSLPDSLSSMRRLRILNVSENALEKLPFKALSKLPLTELHARKNKLSGTLVESGVDSLPLQILDVSANQLSELVAPGQQLSMPSLHTITLSANRIKALPDVSSWTGVLTISADENSITEIPQGFNTLEAIRHADFSSNDIRVIPAEIGRMENLTLLRITGNPLRDKKFVSLATEELKDALAARLPAEEIEDVHVGGNGTHTSRPKADDEVDDSRSEYDDFATPPTSAPQSPARTRTRTMSNQMWPIKAGGVLDRSETESSTLHPVVCSKIAAEHSVRDVRLQNNVFTKIPSSLSFFADTITYLCLSRNELVGEGYMLAEELDLTSLRDLVISNNRMTSLVPLTTYLRAPNLQKLVVSFNRITALPNLREVFPSLTVLDASNNHIMELEYEAIKGMQMVDVSNNDISHLQPRIGLLGGSGGLERFVATGNRFRVPRWNILELGTEATLRFLRSRVPMTEMAEWRAQMGKGEEDSDGFE